MSTSSVGTEQEQESWEVGGHPRRDEREVEDGGAVAERGGGVGPEEANPIAATALGVTPQSSAAAPAPTASAVSAAETKECPRCGEEIKLRAQLCRFCGAELETVRSGYCPACHDIVPVDAGDLCARCGAETIDPHLETHAAAARPIAPVATAPSAAVRLDQFASGLGDLSIAPPEIRKWNWGAFFLSFVWGLSNRVYSSLLILIPFVGWFVIPFVLGAKGNEWAWANKQWESVEHFQRTQKRWAVAGLVVWLVELVLIVIALFAG